MVLCQHRNHLPNFIHLFIFFLENNESKYNANPLVRNQAVSNLDFEEHKLRESRDGKQRENKTTTQIFWTSKKGCHEIFLWYSFHRKGCISSFGTYGLIMCPKFWKNYFSIFKNETQSEAADFWELGQEASNFTTKLRGHTLTARQAAVGGEGTVTSDAQPPVK